MKVIKKKFLIKKLSEMDTNENKSRQKKNFSENEVEEFDDEPPTLEEVTDEMIYLEKLKNNRKRK